LDPPIKEAQQIEQSEEWDQPDVHLPQKPLRGFGVERDMVVLILRMFNLRDC
jgi:hypothetical protein